MSLTSQLKLDVEPLETPRLRIGWKGLEFLMVKTQFITERLVGGSLSM